MKRIGSLLFFLSVSSLSVYAQQVLRSAEEAIKIALENNYGLQAQSLEVEQQLQLQKTASFVPKTYIYHSFDENNLAPNSQALRVYGIQQSIPFPTVWSGRKKLLELNTSLARQQYLIDEWNTKREVVKAYSEIVYRQNRLKDLSDLDSLYSNFREAANQSYQTGDSEYLAKLTADNDYQRIHLKYLQEEEALQIAQNTLGALLHSEDSFEIAFTPLTKADPTDSVITSPGETFYQLSEQQAKKSWNLERQLVLPDISLEYFRGFGYMENSQYLDGYSIGLSIPLWFLPYHHRMQAEKVQVAQVQFRALEYNYRWNSERSQLLAKLNRYEKAVQFLEENGLSVAKEMQNVAEKSYSSGEISYLSFIQILENAAQNRLDYLDNLNNYNQTYWELFYLTSLP